MTDSLPSSEVLAGVIRNMAEGIVVTDAAGHLTFVSRACANLLGYCDPAELIGKPWKVLVAPEYWPTVEAVDARRARGISDHYEIELVHLDGTRRTVLVSGSPQLTGQEFRGTVAVFTDITERKQAEIAEHQHRLQAETLADIVIALVSQTHPTALFDEILWQARRLVPYETANIAMLEGENLRVVAWRGYERFGAQHLIDDLVQPLAQLSIARRAMRHHQPVLLTDTLLEPGWQANPVSAWIRSYLVIPIQVQDYVLGFLRLDAETPCRFTMADVDRLRPLADAAALALQNARLIADARQRAAELEAVRQAALGLTAHLELEAVLNAILEATLKLLPDASDAHIFLYQNDQLSFGAALFSDGRRGKAVATPRRNGLTHTVARLGEMVVVTDMRTHPLYLDAPPDWQGGIIGLPLKISQRVVGVMSIATRKPYTWSESDLRVVHLLADQAAVAIENACLHDEIKLHASQMEQRVAERTAELQAANTSLRQAAVKMRELDRMKSEFLSNVSHELRTPLSNIKLYLDLLENGKPGKTAHYMATLHREANLLQSLIEDLLQISRLDLGRVSPSLKPADVNALVANLVSDRAALAASRGLEIALETAEQLPLVMADPRMLIQVLSNIITNALNYTPAGGHVTVLTGLAECDGRAWDTVTVRDTGRGIPPEDLPHVFERFYRGAAARDAHEPGTGLGLAISQELIQCQGGKITVESRVGSGSTFVVWLPAIVEPGPQV